LEEDDPSEQYQSGYQVLRWDHLEGGLVQAWKLHLISSRHVVDGKEDFEAEWVLYV
jgi:hypothetical protein